jgi:ADP-ribose pyrophosphatase YjhB (NUDIX family)
MPPTPNQTALAVVLEVRDDKLQVLLWQHAQGPAKGRWALPGGYLAPGESLEDSVRRQLAEKVAVAEVAHLEQLGTWSAPGRHPDEWQLATAYLGIVPAGAEPLLPEDTRWHPVTKLPPLAFDHKEIVKAGVERLKAKLSYTNIGFALAPREFSLSELRDLYTAALGHEVSVSNLQRVLVRRGVLVETGETRPSPAGGGRPAQTFRFKRLRLEVTDQFAVLKPPRS